MASFDLSGLRLRDINLFVTVGPLKSSFFEIVVADTTVGVRNSWSSKAFHRRCRIIII